MQHLFPKGASLPSFPTAITAYSTWGARGFLSFPYIYGIKKCNTCCISPQSPTATYYFTMLDTPLEE